MARHAEALVLDSWSVLAYLEDEPAGRHVADLLANARDTRIPVHLSVVNAGEIWYILAREISEIAADQAIADLSGLGIELVDADWQLARRAGRFKSRHKMSYADCFAAALAARQNAELVTGDREFKQVEGEVRIRWVVN